MGSSQPQNLLDPSLTKLNPALQMYQARDELKILGSNFRSKYEKKIPKHTLSLKLTYVKIVWPITRPDAVLYFQPTIKHGLEESNMFILGLTWVI